MRVSVAPAFFVAAAAVLGISVVRHLDGRRAVMVSVAAIPKAAEPVPPGFGEPKAGEWPAPRAQSKGPGWKYEIFTPPEIYYDPVTGKFTVAGRETVEEVVAERVVDAGLVLLAVAREEFPLRLTGYVGGEGGFMGVFENRENGETLLAGTGRDIPQLGLRILRFVVERQRVNIPESMAVNELVAEAVVRDQRTGRETVLHEGRPAWGVRLQARFRDHAGRQHTLTEGQELTLGDQHYRLEKIRLAPAAAELTKVGSDLSPPVRVTLEPEIATPARSP
jgi:hypothetical protein